MRKLLFLLALLTPTLLHAQTPTHAPSSRYDGIWGGYDGEWDHVSRQILAPAEAAPADKYTLRPARGVRSVS